jgi:23S rRNA (pseudouridine1915-N3)-methyltransferase
MLKITLLTVGTIKESYLSLGIQEFEKRLKSFVQLQLIEVKESTHQQPTLALQDEGNGLSKALPKDAYLIVFAIEGKVMSSEGIAEVLEAIPHHHSHVVFIIGGSHGVDAALKKHAHALWSFSSLTFPHQLFRLLVLEQLYRGMSILAHHPYHK